MKRRLQVIALLLAAAVAGALAWSAYAPIHPASRDALFEIPKGTWARRMAGEKAEILPDTITLVLGVNDVLLLRNSDTVPQVFGPVLIMPGQDFRLPFEQAGEHPFACTAHASGQMTVVVKPTPPAGWQRLQWRLQTLLAKAPWRD
ncbi:cupredoxin domain-containing protein [Pseudoduganella sp. R-34]|uniref:cupredoxin domain-containing protein n=1 Tax=unclassified Pseudoduganella TaxID=2637179 RepID=UPI003CEDED95